MFRDPGVVKAPDADKMDVLEPSSGGGSSLNEGRRPRSGSANQDPQQALKCPRCDSTNTKFCYYNNYSTTQPRHFCKNCRRYWTKGGALRNVPVGGGCRKNKRVKPRLVGGVDPTSLEESTSTMLARFNSCTFPSFGCPPNFGDDSDPMLNIAAFSSRLQDSMRLRQQQSSDNSAGTAPDDHHASSFFDMGFPAALMNKTCGTGACGGTCGSHTCAGINDTCGSLMNAFENASMGYTTLPVKLEHEAISYNTNYDLNTCLIDHTRMAGTSATATLASIEDQLSNFSNVPSLDSFNPDALPQMKVQEEQKNFAEQKLPLQLFNHGGPQDSTDHGGLVIADFPLEEKVIMEDKPLINVFGPSLMSADNWQQSSLMNDMLFEPHHNIWGHSRWQDMHALATTTAAGGVL